MSSAPLRAFSRKRPPVLWLLLRINSVEGTQRDFRRVCSAHRIPSFRRTPESRFAVESDGMSIASLNLSYALFAHQGFAAVLEMPRSSFVPVGDEDVEFSRFLGISRGREDQ